MTALRKAHLTEAEFFGQVTELAEILGWSWAHFRPALTKHGWRTPVSGPLGEGFPDLLLVHPKKRREVFAELKVATPVSPAQRRVLEILADAGREVYVWRPKDLDEIARILR